MQGANLHDFDINAPLGFALLLASSEFTDLPSIIVLAIAIEFVKEIVTAEKHSLYRLAFSQPSKSVPFSPWPHEAEQ